MLNNVFKALSSFCRLVYKHILYNSPLLDALFEFYLTIDFQINLSLYLLVKIVSCFDSLKDLFNANACWLVLIYDTLIIPYVAKRISKYVSYIL